MTQNDPSHKAAQHRHVSPKRAIHKDWRLNVVVALMLAAMAIYVWSMDESIVPGSAPGPEMPAAATAE